MAFPEFQGQAVIHFSPGGTYPNMTRVFCDRQRTRASCQEIQVVDVVPRPGHGGVGPIANQIYTPVSRGYDGITRTVWPVQALVCERSGTIHAVVIDLVQVDLSGRIMDVVFVRRITRPVATGRVHLDRDQARGG